MVIGIYIVAQKYYYIKYEYKKIIIIFLSLLLFYIISIIISPYGFWYVKVLLLILFTVSIFLLKIIDFKSVKTIIKMK